jgi:hypothetical protein
MLFLSDQELNLENSSYFRFKLVFQFILSISFHPDLEVRSL